MGPHPREMDIERMVLPAAVSVIRTHWYSSNEYQSTVNTHTHTNTNTERKSCYGLK